MTKTIIHPTTRTEDQKLFEEIADSFLSPQSKDVRIYTEQALARKIRQERRRMQDFDETAIPESAAAYILKRQIELTIASAGLTRFQAAVMTMAMMGWNATDIAARFGLPYHKILRALRISRRKIKKGSSPYYGLWEVYWSEVMRRGYRKPRS